MNVLVLANFFKTSLERFGNSKRKTFSSLNTPGPGMYQVSAPKSSVAYSISPSKQFIKKSETPGPGAYSPMMSENSPRAVIGRSKREHSPSPPTPGPGSYSPEMKGSAIGSMCNY